VSLTGHTAGDLLDHCEPALFGARESLRGSLGSNEFGPKLFWFCIKESRRLKANAECLFSRLKRVDPAVQSRNAEYSMPEIYPVIDHRRSADEDQLVYAVGIFQSEGEGKITAHGVSDNRRLAYPDRIQEVAGKVDRMLPERNAAVIQLVSQ